MEVESRYAQRRLALTYIRIDCVINMVIDITLNGNIFILPFYSLIDFTIYLLLAQLKLFMIYYVSLILVLIFIKYVTSSVLLIC